MSQILKLSVFVLAFIIMSCGPKLTTPPTKEIVPSANMSQESQKLHWQIEWDKALAGSRKEGRVVVITGGAIGRARDELAGVFGKKYNLDVEITSGRGADTSSRLQAQRRAGLYLVDVYIGSAKRLLQTDKPTGALDPLESALILPEVLDGKAWWSGRLLWVDKDRTILTHILYVNTPILINTNQVRLEEIKSYRDLLNPKWKGKIVMDDVTMGGTTASIMFVLGEYIMGWDFVRQLAQHEPVIVRDRRLITEWIARGRYPISMMTSEASEFIKAGAPIVEITPVEGSYLSSASGSLALINKAPHPNAAKLFINWLLSKGGQMVLSEGLGYPSARVDTPKDGFDPGMVIKPGVKYILSDNEEALMKRIKFEEVLAAEIFGPLLK